MVEDHQGVPMDGIFRVAGDATNTPTFRQQQQQQHPQLEPMKTADEDENAAIIAGTTSKRKSFAMSDSPPALLPPPTEEEGESRRGGDATTFAPAAPGGEKGVFKHQAREKEKDLETRVSSVSVGETLRVPLSGRSVPFRVVKRRGRGFSSVVFECEREEKEEEEDGGVPPLVTVKVCLYVAKRFQRLSRGYVRKDQQEHPLISDLFGRKDPPTALLSDLLYCMYVCMYAPWGGETRNLPAINNSLIPWSARQNT